MVEVDYEVTKAFMYRKYWSTQWSYDDFEDRYHDAWEAYLRYGVPDGVVPLTAFCTMFRTQYSKRLENKLHVLLSEEEREIADTGYVLNTDLCLLEHFIQKLTLTDNERTLVHLKLSGLTNAQIGEQLGVSPSRVDELWRVKVLTPIVNGNSEMYKKTVSLDETTSGLSKIRKGKLNKLSS